MNKLSGKGLQLSPREMGLLYLLLLVALFAFYIYVWSPGNREITRMQNEIQTLSRQLQNTDAERLALARLQRERDELVAQIQVMESQIPEQIDRRQVLEFLYDVSEEVGVSITRIAFAEPTRYLPEALSERIQNETLGEIMVLPVEMVVHGSWERLHRYLYGIFHLSPSLLRISNINIVPQGASTSEDGTSESSQSQQQEVQMPSSALGINMTLQIEFLFRGGNSS